MKQFIVILCLAAFANAGAQQYNVLLIPDSLRKNADAVKRYEELKVSIKNIDKAVIKRKYAITILNEAGDEFAGYSNNYRKMESLHDIDGNLYDAAGKKIKSVKKKDIADESDNDGLASDSRVKRHNFYCRDYPYTVEYEDEQELDGIFFLPYWWPQPDEKFSVQESHYVVETPANYILNCKQFNYVGKPNIVNTAKGTTYNWQMTNAKAIESEYRQPSWEKVTTSVFIAPKSFSIGGYEGDMSSWLNLGKFIAQLNKDRDQLPGNVKSDVHRIAGEAKTREEKVKLLYQYMQDNTRYISIQLGIGSWQPFDANYVATKKYGDCKALSNYMKSILKEAGISSNYVLINAGSNRQGNGLWEDFPSPYFSHAILCVPNEKDSIWLECTSQTESAGFMGSFTGNRKALLIADDGGHIVSTPTYKAADNLQYRSVVASIDADGNLHADVHTTFTGQQEEMQHSLMYDATKEQREKFLNQSINLPTYKVEKNEYSEEKKAIPVIREDLNITSPNYAGITGKRLFIRPNLFNKAAQKLSPDSTRVFDIEIRYAYTDVDSVSITLPEGYRIEAVPKDVSIQNKFGSYHISFKVEDNKVQMYREKEESAGKFPAAAYNDLVEYYNAVYKADRSQLVFVKKDD